MKKNTNHKHISTHLILPDLSIHLHNGQSDLLDIAHDMPDAINNNTSDKCYTKCVGDFFVPVCDEDNWNKGCAEL
jgi:hypothetical protein